MHVGLAWLYRALAHDVTELTKSVFIWVFLVKPLKTCGKKVVDYHIQSNYVPINYATTKVHQNN